MAETETRSQTLTPFLGEDEPPYVTSLEHSTDWPHRLAAMVEYHPEKWMKFGPWRSKKAAQNTASNLNVYWRRGGFYNRGFMLETTAGRDPEVGWCLWLRVRVIGDEAVLPPTDAKWRG